MYKLFTVLVEGWVEQFFPNHLNLVRYGILGLSGRGFMRTEFSFKPLGEDIMFQLNYVEELRLQSFESVFELVVLVAHLLK